MFGETNTILFWRVFHNISSKDICKSKFKGWFQIETLRTLKHRNLKDMFKVEFVRALEYRKVNAF